MNPTNITYPLLDKLCIISIYISVLDEPGHYSSAIFAITLVVLFVHLPISKARLNKEIIGYYFAVINIYVFLFLVGIAKGNLVSDILLFIYPPIYMIYVYVYYELIKKYDIDKYVRHYFFVGVILSIKIIIYYVLFNSNSTIPIFVAFTEDLPIINPDSPQSTWIANNLGFTRVFVGQSLLIPISILAAFYLNIKNSYIITLAILGVASLAITQTFSVIVAQIIVLFYVIRKVANLYFQIFIMVCSSLVLSYFYFSYYDEINTIIEAKIEYSLPVKASQLNDLFLMLAEDFFLGKGLGYIYPNGSSLIELVFVHFLITTGLLGFFMYLYFYFYWAFKSIKYIKVDTRIRLILLGYFLIVMASFSNPYLLGGFSGMYLVPILASLYFINYSKYRH